MKTRAVIYAAILGNFLLGLCAGWQARIRHEEREAETSPGPLYLEEFTIPPNVIFSLQGNHDVVAAFISSSVIVGSRCYVK